MPVNDSIRYARAFEKYDLAWAEDMIDVGNLGPGSDAPKNWVRDLIDHRAVDIIYPDPLTAGGIRETKRIADYASMYGVQTVIHFAGSPVGCMASV
jgi:L-alanine-DL-glutamate epimerase-like enolase superfamily enzyme